MTWLVASHSPICLPSGEQTDLPGAVQLPLLVLPSAGGGASGVVGAAGAAGCVPTDAEGAGAGGATAGTEGAAAGADGAGEAAGAGAGAGGDAAGADGAEEATGEGAGAAPEPEPLVLLVLSDGEVPVPQEPTGAMAGKEVSF